MEQLLDDFRRRACRGKLSAMRGGPLFGNVWEFCSSILGLGPRAAGIATLSFSVNIVERSACHPMRCMMQVTLIVWACLRRFRQTFSECGSDSAKLGFRIPSQHWPTVPGTTSPESVGFGPTSTSLWRIWPSGELLSNSDRVDQILISSEFAPTSTKLGVILVGVVPTCVSCAPAWANLERCRPEPPRHFPNLLPGAGAPRPPHAVSLMFGARSCWVGMLRMPKFCVRVRVGLVCLGCRICLCFDLSASFPLECACCGAHAKRAF